MREFGRSSSRAPHPPRSPTKETCCADFQLCARATLELYSQQRVWTSTGIDPSPIRRKMTSRLGSVVRWVNSILDSTWEEKEVEDSRRRSTRDDSTGNEV
ncbi:hypothetical protein PoB_007169800 [Plakobranchus ocellatus]|uniref:Uncharacterized protein n=1 Tax=Plakobranchus ocellatus TaxID=259542 RepID=A0AAV4DLN2_9GAST|nr:hypothetical protein PoB_007169800 [Plakobranchus ocellatus]